MRKTTVACVLFVMIAFALPLAARNDIPVVKLGEADLKLYGWVQGWWNEDTSTIKWQSVRLRSKLTTPSRLMAEVRVELTGADHPGSNWLREAFLNYKLTRNWFVSGGRFSRAVILTTPRPDKRRTVIYPRHPTKGVYAYGFQILGDFGNNWRLVADITGNSGKPFDESGNFDEVEASARLKKVIGNTEIAAAAMLASQRNWGGLDFKHRVRESFYFKGMAYSVNDAGGDQVGAFVLAAWSPLPWLEAHSMFDTLSDEGQIWTYGVRLWTKRDHLALTIDQETAHGAAEDNHRFLARLQVRF